MRNYLHIFIFIQRYSLKTKITTCRQASVKYLNKMITRQHQCWSFLSVVAIICWLYVPTPQDTGIISDEDNCDMSPNRTVRSVKVKADIPLAHSFSLSTG